MRILHIVHQYLPRWVGGVEIYTDGLAQAQEQAGHTVAIFVRENTPGGLEFASHNGVRVYRWQGGERGEMQQWLTTLGDSTIQSAFQRVLDEFQPEVVHLQHLLGLPTTLVSMLAARRIPMVMTLHDYSLLCGNTKLLTNDTEQLCQGPRAYINCAQCGLAKAGRTSLRPFATIVAPVFAFRALALKAMFRHIHQFIAPTEFVQRMHVQLANIPISKIRVIDYGIELPVEAPPPFRTVGALQVAFIGSIARLKGVHLLITAFNLMPAEAKLRIAGDLTRQPSYTAELLAMAKHPNISFLGVCDRAAVQDLLDWSDILAVPSIWYEVSPLVIHEAWARGKPVMVGDFGSLASLVKHDVNGWCVKPPHRPTAWAEALQELHYNRAKLKVLQTQIRVPKNFAQHVAEMEHVYSHLPT